MKNFYIRTLALSFCALFFLLFTSCSGIQGYGVLLWSVPEYNLSDGEVVPVYLKSNIGKIYAIGVPGTDTKIEVPLWQITEPESKRKANDRAEQYTEYQHQYAAVKIDGLAIRDGAVNTANQIYRLRENEIIKILYKGEGQLVMRGSTPLEGDWMWVLTSDGTEGWCFSYNLTLYDDREGLQIQVVDVNGENDEIVQTISKKRWYPEYYATMINQGKVNLQRMRFDYGFDPGLVSGTVSVANESVRSSYPYIGITKKGNNSYSFDDTPISILIRSENYISVEYVDEIGRRISYGFVAFAQDSEEVEDTDESGVPSLNYIEQVIATETERRTNQYNQILDLAESFYSSNYGTITFARNDSATFTWRGYQRLVSSDLEGIPTSGGTIGRGNASINYFIGNSLTLEFDGVLTLQFETTDEELNLLYKIESNGIRFESVENFLIDDATVTGRSSNPTVMFFTKQ